MGKFSATLSAISFLTVCVSPVTAETISPGDILVVDEDGGVVRHYSAVGTDLGIFADNLSAPAWIATDPAGNVYVSEYRGNAIRKFSPAGTLLLTISTSFTPGGVAIGDDDTIYVAHYDAGRIHHYSAFGDDLGLFVTYGGCENGCGTDFIKFDSSGNLYVGDFQPIGRIRLISADGVDLGNFVTNIPGVEGIAFDASGNLYASNAKPLIVERYSLTGVDLGPFAEPAGYGIAFDSLGNLWSAASGTGRVEKFSPSGEHLGGFGIGGRDLVIVPGPVKAEQCKHGGWKTFAFPRMFKNQGDCMHSVDDAADVDE